jgi:hypothetical protein
MPEKIPYTCYVWENSVHLLCLRKFRTPVMSEKISYTCHVLENFVRLLYLRKFRAYVVWEYFVQLLRLRKFRTPVTSEKIPYSCYVWENFVHLSCLRKFRTPVMSDKIPYSCYFRFQLQHSVAFCVLLQTSPAAKVIQRVRWTNEKGTLTEGCWQEKAEVLVEKKNPSLYHTVNHKSHNDWYRTEAVPQRLETGRLVTRHLNHSADWDNNQKQRLLSNRRGHQHSSYETLFVIRCWHNRS